MPDLAPCVFWLFPKLKRSLRETRFKSIEEIKKIEKALMALPERDYLACFQYWKKRWHKYIILGGDYFKGAEIDLEEQQTRCLNFTNKTTLLAHSCIQFFFFKCID